MPTVLRFEGAEDFIPYNQMRGRVGLGPEKGPRTLPAVACGVVYNIEDTGHSTPTSTPSR